MEILTRKVDEFLEMREFRSRGYYLWIMPLAMSDKIRSGLTSRSLTEIIDLDSGTRASFHTRACSHEQCLSCCGTSNLNCGSTCPRQNPLNTCHCSCHPNTARCTTRWHTNRRSTARC